MKAIEIKNLTKKYKNIVAVDDISLDIEEGEIFSLLGENGAGKSTTISILCSLINKTSGSVKIMGHDIDDEEEKIKKIVSLSPQQTAVANNLTVKENLKFIASLYNSSKESEEKAEKFINDFSLVEVKNNRAKTLSGGMQRRLSIAMALISEPKVLFLDEPTLGLDVRARRDLWKIISGLKGKITIILTSHYMEESEALSDRIAIMKKGKIIEVGNVKELKEKANTLDFEQAFLTLTEDGNE